MLYFVFLSTIIFGFMPYNTAPLTTDNSGLSGFKWPYLEIYFLNNYILSIFSIFLLISSICSAIFIPWQISKS